METKVATCYSHVGLLVEGWGQQTTHKIFDSKYLWPRRHAGIKMEQKLMKWPTSGSQFETHPKAGSSL